jgi:RNA polymerase sigma-70 factor (family 1)
MDLVEDGLLRPIRFGDEVSFERLYRQYWPKLYIYAFNVLREKELCEDIVQQVFLDLWTKRHNAQIANLHSYLHQSVKYQIFNHFRKSKYKKQLLKKLDLISTQRKIDEAYEEKELRDRIRDVISQLPGQRRIIFEMSRHKELSNKEISRNLNISVQTVKNQISESLKFIRRSLNCFYLFF